MILLLMIIQQFEKAEINIYVFVIKRKKIKFQGFKSRNDYFHTNLSPISPLYD